MTNQVMNRSLLIKTFALAAGLAVVAGAIYFVTRGLAGGSRESGELPTFFEQFIIAGGPIVWFVLLPMSLITVYFAAEYFFTIRRSKLLPEDGVAGITGTIRRFGVARLDERLADQSGRHRQRRLVPHTKRHCRIPPGPGLRIAAQNRMAQPHRQRLADGGLVRDGLWND